MSSNIFLILLVVLNLSTILFAYHVNLNDDPSQALFRKLEDSANDEGRLVNLHSLKRALEQEQEQNPNSYYLVPCYPTSSHILCNHLSRRDTGFLRFGRKR